MPDQSLENQLRDEGHTRIAGIDEAGRGPLAGPVSVAAVVLPADFEHDVLNDSKKLTEKKREALFAELTTNPAITWSAVLIDSIEIDQINILQATWKGMADAFASLSPAAEVALIDGKPVKNFPGHSVNVIKGDSKSLSIAAASVIAKVSRDRLMVEYAEKYPQYGFEKHKGYGTKAHIEALQEHGPCEIHRMTFAPVAAAASA